MNAEPYRAEPAQIITILTTEHFALQTARSAELLDAQSRSTVFMTSLSSSLIALAFVGQLTRMGTPFFVFACVMFATLYVMGVVTFLRVAQTSIEDNIHVRGINRIRHYYLEAAPQLEPYFVHATHDDMRSVIEGMGISPNRWQTYLTSASMLAFIASVMLGVLIGLFIHVAFQAAVSISAVVAGTLLIANFFSLKKLSTSMWETYERQFPPRFPLSRK